MARGRPSRQTGLWVCLVLVAGVVFGEEQETKPFGETCLEDFTAGIPGLVLDTDASVQNGATFLSSPRVHRSRDCMRACCKDPDCNLALVEQAPALGEDHIQGCFLLNCLYEQTFVCRFARKVGFLNFLKRDVYDTYHQAMQKHGSSGSPSGGSSREKCLTQRTLEWAPLFVMEIPSFWPLLVLMAAAKSLIPWCYMRRAKR